MATTVKSPAFPELTQALLALRQHFIAAGTFSFFVNLLMLVPSLYMLQIYDRVLTSRNETTMWMLTFLMLGLYVLEAALELVRSRLLVRAGIRLEEVLNRRVFAAAFEANLRKVGGNPGQALTDLTNIRQFLTGNGLFAFFDAPWAPIYLAVIFFLHPVLGWFSLAGACVLVALTWTTEAATRKPLAAANNAAIKSNAYATNNLANAEVIEAMGMLPALADRWLKRHNTHLALQAIASDRAGLIGAVTKFVRLTMQSLILGVGALLVIKGDLTPGGMIAASILMGRALSPVEQLIGNWKGFVANRGGYSRLGELLRQFPARPATMSLPPPRGEIAVEGLVAVPPGSQVAVLRGIGMAIAPGEVVAIIGPSASGKSTLARMLVGIWPPHGGKVRLDGADVYLWNKTELGPYIGYLPQDIELFEGTIAENIARFGEVDSDKVIAAAKRAGVHEMILRFPLGYDTQIGPGGDVLSGGQRQRIALARALYGDPALIVLDEPNSNLDDAGEAALVQSVLQLKAERKTVVVITHRTNIIGVVDRILILREGVVQAYGPRDQVLRALMEAQQKSQPAAQAPGRPPAAPQRAAEAVQPDDATRAVEAADATHSSSSGSGE
ncbi:MAG: type I secretion system permease/ATPase [Sulfurisoma sp.]|nr:type I secretion system permease/ATPase [Sulfurisoma sp.]